MSSARELEAAGLPPGLARRTAARLAGEMPEERGAALMRAQRRLALEQLDAERRRALQRRYDAAAGA